VCSLGSESTVRITSVSFELKSDMPMPTLNLHISGNVLAGYGAVLSTITAAVQVVSHFKDRVNLGIQVQHNMEIVGDPRYAGMTLTMIRAFNKGRRAVTVTNVGAYRLHPHKAFVVPDTMPRTPCELTEGKQLQAMFDQSDVDFSQLESYEVYTATGKTFRLHVAPWYKRWWSRWQRKREWKKKEQEARAAAGVD
jgi:hypothetical protein